MNLLGRFDMETIDLTRDVPTTAADIAVLRRLRQGTRSWLTLTTTELHALLPLHALDERPPTPAGAKPFELP